MERDGLIFLFFVHLSLLFFSSFPPPYSASLTHIALRRGLMVMRACAWLREDEATMHCRAFFKMFLGFMKTCTHWQRTHQRTHHEFFFSFPSVFQASILAAKRERRGRFRGIVLYGSVPPFRHLQGFFFFPKAAGSWVGRKKKGGRGAREISSLFGRASHPFRLEDIFRGCRQKVWSALLPVFMRGR